MPLNSSSPSCSSRTTAIDTQPSSAALCVCYSRPSLWLRSVGFMLYLIVFTVLYGTACMLSFGFIPLSWRYAMIATWCRITLRVLRGLNGISYEVQGMEMLPKGPAVLLAKHQSAWETFALLGLMPRPLCFVFKRELLWIPFFGWALGMLNMIHINRKKTHHAFNAVLAQGKKCLAKGAWVIMFPEGTRTARGKKGRYKSGGARFAIAAQAPIIPIAHNAGRVWPKGSFLKYPGHVTISIGPAIPTAGLTPEQANQKTVDWIETQMHTLDPSAYQKAECNAPQSLQK